MLVRDIMHCAVCIDPAEKLAAAARMLRDENVGCLPVCCGAQVLGMLTDRDIVVRSAAQGRDPNEMSVREAMSVGALSCGQEDTVERAACLMQQAHVRRLVVLDRHLHVVGVVSASDIGASGIGANELGRCVSKRLPFEVVFYKEVLDHFGRTHRSELMRVPVARGTRDEAIRTAIGEFEQTRQIRRWDALADGYEVISACTDS